MYVLGLESGYTVKYGLSLEISLGSGHILPYIPPLEYSVAKLNKCIIVWLYANAAPPLSPWQADPEADPPPASRTDCLEQGTGGDCQPGQDYNSYTKLPISSVSTFTNGSSNVKGQ